MFLRFLLVLLFALNLGVGGWLLFGHHARSMPPATDPGVPELQLLSELPGNAATVAPAARTMRTSGRCLRIGPFTTQAGMRKAFNALMPRVPQIQFQRENVTKSTGWWVYLPAFPTQDQAISAARTLAGEGVTDYYVITVGDHENTVSLGLFHNPDNAKRRFAHIRQLGFQPKLTQRMETLPEYWVDIALPAAASFQWRQWVKLPTVHANAIDCADTLQARNE